MPSALAWDLASYFQLLISNKSTFSILIVLPVQAAPKRLPSQKRFQPLSFSIMGLKASIKTTEDILNITLQLSYKME